MFLPSLSLFALAEGSSASPALLSDVETVTVDGRWICRPEMKVSRAAQFAWECGETRGIVARSRHEA